MAAGAVSGVAGAGAVGIARDAESVGREAEFRSWLVWQIGHSGQA